MVFCLKQIHKPTYLLAYRTPYLPQIQTGVCQGTPVLTACHLGILSTPYVLHDSLSDDIISGN